MVWRGTESRGIGVTAGSTGQPDRLKAVLRTRIRTRLRGTGTLLRLEYRLQAVWILLAFLFPACGGSSAPPFDVLLVTLDTTRADFLGTYGSAGARTPNLDGLALEGACFENALSTAALTPVSHASILTGLDNAEHGLRVSSAGSGCELAPGIPTITGILKERGYATAAIQSAYPVCSRYGFQRGFDVFDSVETRGETEDRAGEVDRLQRRSDETTDRALAFLGSTPSPFFLWIHYWDPHDRGRVPPADSLPPDLPRLPDGSIAASRELYAVEVDYVDAQFGRVLDFLRQRGSLDRTIVVVVADHGEGLGDHGWWHHRMLYQEQIHVPYLVRIPGMTPGRRVSQLVRTTDIVPTICDYLGLEALPEMSGRSLRALLEGRNDPPRLAFSEQINGYDDNAQMLEHRPLEDFVYCVSDGAWKVLWRPAHPGESELYHLSVDPREEHDLLEQEPAELLRLLRALAEHDAWVDRPFPDTMDAKTRAATGRALDALGYASSEAEPEDAGPSWAWLCPEHRELALPRGQRCSRCSSKPILIVASETR